LALRQRVVILEKCLADENVTLPSSRVDHWKQMLHMQNRRVAEFRQRMKKEGFQDGDIGMFANTVSQMCQDTNQRVAHFNIPLPDPISEEVIKGTCVMEIKTD